MRVLTFAISKEVEPWVNLSDYFWGPIKEKTSRFEEGVGDITVRSPNLLTIFNIEYKDVLSLFKILDIKDAAKTMISILEASLFGFDVRIIEESHLVTINNKIAATAVIAAEVRYYNPPFKFVDQHG